jgi:hypothetical protein
MVTGLPGPRFRLQGRPRRRVLHLLDHRILNLLVSLDRLEAAPICFKHTVVQTYFRVSAWVRGCVGECVGVWVSAWVRGWVSE